MVRLAVIATALALASLCPQEVLARQSDDVRARAPAQTPLITRPPQSQQRMQRPQQQRRSKSASDVPPGVRVPDWKDLDDRQRGDLASFADRWDRLPASRRVQILERYDRFQALPPEKQNALREGAINFQQMSPQQRQKMRDSLQTMRSLPPEQQRALRQQWQAMSPEQRRAWLDAGGPGVVEPPKP